MANNEPETFLIPDGQNFILYAPLRSRLYLLNKRIKEALRRFQRDGSKPRNEADAAILDMLAADGIFQSPSGFGLPEKGVRFCPTSAILLPTRDCNLRCVYCYSNAGLKAAHMSEELAERTVDFLVENAMNRGSKAIHLDFGGGGEPTVAWDCLTHAVEYCRKEALRNGLEYSNLITTNGVLSEKKIQWIAANIRPGSLQISFDGPGYIQDVQRPTAAGAGSFEAVLKTMRRFDKLDFAYALRCTVTPLSASRLMQILEYVHENSRARSILFESLFPHGRCQRTRWVPPLASEFTKNMKKILDKADEYGIAVLYSPIMPSMRKYFCGAEGHNFIVTPEGLVTSCIEVATEEDPLSEVFVFGRYDWPSGKFRFDEDKWRRLLGRSADSIPRCRRCFAKYSCAGDCVKKVCSVSGNMYDVGKFRCAVNRELLRHCLKNELGQNNHIAQGYVKPWLLKEKNYVCS